jgi:hypothetical protein
MRVKQPVHMCYSTSTEAQDLEVNVAGSQYLTVALLRLELDPMTTNGQGACYIDINWVLNISVSAREDCCSLSRD